MFFLFLVFEAAIYANKDVYIIFQVWYLSTSDHSWLWKQTAYLEVIRENSSELMRVSWFHSFWDLFYIFEFLCILVFSFYYFSVFVTVSCYVLVVSLVN